MPTQMGGSGYCGVPEGVRTECARTWRLKEVVLGSDNASCAPSKVPGPQIPCPSSQLYILTHEVLGLPVTPVKKVQRNLSPCSDSPKTFL